MKKVAFFLGEMNATYQSKILEVFRREAVARSIELHVFNNFGSYGTNIFHGYGEKNIITIPDLSTYDGILMAADTLNINGMEAELRNLIKKTAHCPVVNLRQEDDVFCSVAVDNYHSICDVVEHLITVHGFTRICHMSGPLTMEDAQIRLKGYRDTMEKHGLLVKDSMIFEGDYWKKRNHDAVKWFVDESEIMPQAIVCANDYMAVSLMDALHDRGIRVPEDIVVTGMDDIEEASICVPQLTTMYVDSEEIAMKAIELLEEIWNGGDVPKMKYVRPKLYTRGSCGCKPGLNKESLKTLFKRKEILQHTISRCSTMHTDYSDTGNLEELLQVVQTYIDVSEYDDIFICICDQEEKKEELVDMMGRYTEHMYLRAIIRKDEIQICKERFEKRELLPTQYKKDGEILFFFNLHDRNNCIGYMVIRNWHFLPMRFLFYNWLLNFSTSLSRINPLEDSISRSEIKSQYGRDELTGLYDRREMEKALQNRYQQTLRNSIPFYILFVDVDQIGLVNDNYGHLEGDMELCSVASVLSEVVGDNGTVARTGGDEFMVCFRNADEEAVKQIMKDIQDKIDAYNDEMFKPYEMSVSMGYAGCSGQENMIFYVQKATEMAERSKQTKKRLNER